MDAFIQQLFADPEMLRMGHHQRLADRNLGLAWIYYALGRVIRPSRAVVIGSWRGFVPAVLARALADNLEGGEVLFLDPSLADGFWMEPESVSAHFRGLGTPNVRHCRLTTQAYVGTPEYRALDAIGLLMIDGYHTAEQSRFDYLAFVDKLAPDAVVMFHDSVVRRDSTFYGEEARYEHTVCLLMDRLRATPGLEVLTLPYGGGLTLVRGRPESRAALERPF